MYLHHTIWTSLYILSLLAYPIDSQLLKSVLSLLNFAYEDSEKPTSRLSDQKDLLSEYDFIIVGAGTAGCVIANRLSEVSDWTVLLIEAGGNENILMDVPLMAGYNQQTSANWRYKTQPSDKYCTGLANKQCSWHRGKVLGGSSVLNFMAYTRGSQGDYDNWEEMGNDGWGWHDVLPYFKKIETFDIPSLFDSEYHNKYGPLHVEYANYRSEMEGAWVAAAQELGFKNVDYNGAYPSGVSHLQVSMDNGTRHSSNRAYLQPVIDRPNLHVSTNSFVTKLLLDDTNTAVIGVEMTKNNELYALFARNEVIVSGGAINSPQLLMLSGIGPRDHLESLNIDVVKDLPVGYNLMDHISTGGIQFYINSPSIVSEEITNNFELIDEWIKYRSGPLSIAGGLEALVFMDLKDKFNCSLQPNVELLFFAGGLNTNPMLQQMFNVDKKIYDEVYELFKKSNAFMIFPMLLRPKSRGRIFLRNSDPRESPILIPNYLDSEEDMQNLVEGIKVAIEISKQPSLVKLGTKMYRLKNV